MVENIMVCLDCSAAALTEAEELGCVGCHTMMENAGFIEHAAEAAVQRES